MVSFGVGHNINGSGANKMNDPIINDVDKAMQYADMVNTVFESLMGDLKKKAQLFKPGTIMFNKGVLNNDLAICVYDAWQVFVVPIPFYTISSIKN